MLKMIETWMLVILVIMMPGVWSGEWGVAFNDQCSFKGTSVVLRCSYDYPDGQSVWLRQWYKQRNGQLERVFLPRGHFDYLGDNRHNCDLRINNVQYTDQGLYYFYFRTTGDKWLSIPPLYLTVKELTVAVQPRTDVVEGQTVSLTCGSQCPTLLQRRFVWFRDGQRVTNINFQARKEDAGSYTCAVEGQEGVQSAALPLNVKYAPTEVTLSQSPPTDVVSGTPLTFSCSSDANPPVQEGAYSLYKDEQLISTGQTHTIAEVLPEHSGRYHCRAWNNMSRDGRGVFHSPALDLDVQYLPVNISAAADRSDVSASSSVNLTCSSDANPPAYNYVWYKRASSAANSSSNMQRVGSGQVLTLTSVTAAHAGFYVCQAWNRVGESNSTEVLLLVKEEFTGVSPLVVLSGVVSFVLVTLLITLLLYRRRNQQKHTEQKELSSGAPGTSLNEDPSTIYTNISSIAYSETPPPHKTSPRENTCFSYEDPDVTYSAVTIKPRKPPRHINRDPENVQSNAEEDDSVIYATVNKSREV